ncbi:hypothetical protein ACRALDRAFT_2017323 [Sodiomyces alcalophilus JCM 7366]|uniref:uncharacterized protein n=1 Tax=Sodiomyces alcalophilus JCM 7366 TaxID=591952 RepID=UPI0039B436F4
MEKHDKSSAQHAFAHYSRSAKKEKEKKGMRPNLLGEAPLRWSIRRQIAARNIKVLYTSEVQRGMRICRYSYIDQHLVNLTANSVSILTFLPFHTPLPRRAAFPVILDMPSFRKRGYNYALLMKMPMRQRAFQTDGKDHMEHPLWLAVDCSSVAPLKRSGQIASDWNDHPLRCYNSYRSRISTQKNVTVPLTQPHSVRPKPACCNENKTSDLDSYSSPQHMTLDGTESPDQTDEPMIIQSYPLDGTLRHNAEARGERLENAQLHTTYICTYAEGGVQSGGQVGTLRIRTVPYFTVTRQKFLKGASQVHRYSYFGGLFEVWRPSGRYVCDLMLEESLMTHQRRP